MKAAVAAALIFCGTALILAPAVFDYLHVHDRQQVLIARPETVGVSGGAPMSDGYSMICWGIGAGMIGIAVVKSIARKSNADDSDAS